MLGHAPCHPLSAVQLTLLRRQILQASKLVQSQVALPVPGRRQIGWGLAVEHRLQRKVRLPPSDHTSYETTKTCNLRRALQLRLGFFLLLAQHHSAATRHAIERSIAHSLGAVLSAKWLSRYGGQRVAGAFLVAPADIDQTAHPEVERIRAFGPLPHMPLPLPTAIDLATRRQIAGVT